MKTTLRRFRAHPWLTGLVVAVVVVGVGVGSYFAARSDSPAAAIATTTTTTVSTGTIKQSVSATGTLAPAKDESLNFSVSGRVTSVKVKVGQRVTKGQTLATVESASLAATVAQAKSTVASDTAKVSNDENNAASDTQLAADEAALTAANNQLASAKDQLASATMTSPIDGAVAAVSLTVGESVSGGSSSSSSSSTSGGGGLGSGGLGTSTSSTSSTSTAQVQVISTNSWIANATVDATSVDLIKTGDQAQLSIPGATGTVYGTIDSIGLVSSSTSGTPSYPVVIDVTGSPAGLHDGASVTATLIYKQLANVVVISTIALHQNSTGGEYVNKLVNGKTVQTTVQVGLSSGGQTQITSGLAAGDKILVPQIQRITGGRTGTGGTLPSFPAGGAGGGFGGGNFPGGNFPGGGLGG